LADALHRIGAHASVNGEALELRPHLLRHRHAYKARSAHGDVFAAKRLGHSSLKHLERYSQLSDDEEQTLLERM
jgi:integrase